MVRTHKLLRWTTALAVAAAATLGVVTAQRASAATLQQVTSFGSNPGALTMWSYRPDNTTAGAPLVIALHGCTQDANGYLNGSGWRDLADRNGITVVLPQQGTANNMNKCFNWFQSGDVTRGQGEVASIASMVQHAITTYSANPARVYVTGLSGGGAMTASMLAAYPDLFAGGSINAGIAHGCATTVAQAYSCMNPGVDKTPKAWGDLARAGYAAWSGPRPKVAIWHGQSDTTVASMNGRELRDQWTDVAGVGQSPTATGTLASGVTWSEYGGGTVRLTEIAGMTHGTPVDPGTGPTQCGTAGAYFIDTVCGAYYDAKFFGLIGSSPTPTPTATPTGTATATPTPTPTPTATATPTCVTATNYAHVQAGRARNVGGYALANGSNDNLGLYNTFYTSAVRETSPGYWQKC
ncbi:alpha/beta hydrolase family esterase [Knoellia sp. CPCC 206453]|uniref:extracellular catalytic domain type 1 short-chain-length polyhydroxyalkanoate depolymerase n=1 Tax=Knoellia pratensis TaxID=3404796 RepID=UPI00361779F1